MWLHVKFIGYLFQVLLPAFVLSQGVGNMYQRDDTEFMVAQDEGVEGFPINDLAFDDEDGGAHVMADVTQNHRYTIETNGTTCVDKMKGCLRYVKYSETHRHVLEGRCDRSCRYCGPPKCFDKRDDCSELKLQRECKDVDMKDKCEKSCGYCVTCEDKYNPGYCLYLKTFDKCNADLRMQDYCHHTCGFCKLPEPAACMKTEHGCCWDKTTAKRTVGGNQCPTCADKFKRLCKQLEKGCISSAFVRKNCQKTCNYCPHEGAVCNDDPVKTHLCKFWKKELDFCNKNPDVMRHFCPVTCGMNCTVTTATPTTVALVT